MKARSRKDVREGLGGEAGGTQWFDAEQLPVGVARLTAEGRVLYANPHFRTLFGYGERDLPLLHFLDLCGHTAHAAWIAHLHKLRDQQSPSVTQSTPCVSAGGHSFNAAVTLCAVPATAGCPQHLLALFDDRMALARSHAAERSARSARHLKQSVEQAAIGITHITPDGRFEYVNQRFCELLGYERNEILGRPVRDFTYPEDYDRGMAVKRFLLQGGTKSKSDQKRFLRKDGGVIWVKRWLSLVEDDEGHPQYIISVVDDITEARLTAERYRAMFENAAVGITQIDLDGMLVDVNDKFCTMLEYSRDELCGKSIRDITHPDDFGTGAAFRQRVIHDHNMPAVVGEKRFIRKSGEVIWARRTMSVVRDNVGAPVFIISVVEDVSERKRTEEALRTSEETLRATFSQAGVGILISLPDMRILTVNEKYCQMLGYTREEAMNLTIPDINRNCDLGAVLENRTKMMRGEIQQTTRERQLLRKDGTVIWVTNSTSLVRDKDGVPQHFVTVTEDITDRKLAEEQLRQLAHYDVLTNLPNRALFYERLQTEIAHTLRHGSHMAVMFLDVDRFKYVNDTLGHAAGDRLLQQLGGRLAKAVRSQDTVGRLSGDEFAIVIPNLKNPADAKMVAQKLVESLNEPVDMDGVELYVSASIGITLCPGDGQDAERLVRNADTAMYRAKELGGNAYEFFAPEMNAHGNAVLKLGNELRRALERNEFLLYYQPKVRLSDGELAGFEALLRWQRPGHGLVMPGEFVHLLEETGLIVPAGEWALEEACRQLGAWRKAGLPLVPIAVNVSARQFRVKQLAARIGAILTKHDVHPSLLELEITEGFLAQKPEDAAQIVDALAKSGIRVAIDDFGTGYSNLAQLKRFSVDAVKIDRSFVRDITADSDDAAIVRAIISMAHSLGLLVVAEGVERKDQLEFLLQNQCDQVQGYYFSYPKPPEDITVLLEDRFALKRLL